VNSQIAKNHVLRGLILGIAYAAMEQGAGIPIIKAMLIQEGHTLKEADILNQCHYLKSKDLVEIESIRNPIQNISRDIVRITSKGIDVMEGITQMDGLALGGE
jgi:hypothetical protein